MGNSTSSRLARYRRFKDWVTRTETVMAVALLVMLYLLLIAQVFFRYVLSSPLGWTEELARFTFVWLVFMGSALLAAKNSHIVVTFIADLFGRSVSTWVIRAAALIVTAAAAVVAWTSLDFVQATTNLLSPGIGVPMAYVYAAPAIGFLLVALHSLEFVITGRDPADSEDITEVVV